MTKPSLIKGISVCNPVDLERDYLLYTVDYAIKNGYDHLQIIGPIHDFVKGNIDGMTLYKKYSRFNNEKDLNYVTLSEKLVNEACDKAKKHNIKVYVWHHELYLPNDFKKVYPETVNDYGDIEVSHPLVKDFLENKIIDFFNTYPKTDGIILTLHETSVPLLKLKNQKLDKIERVKYVTKILYNVCRSYGKELIVRPFASIEEDYVSMTKAYEEISNDLMIMDKWTQFDWSLTMPSNPFFNKIKSNPLFVEADIFGEFFGKGRLPLMLRKHIAKKFDYCKKFNPKGYVARIDRGGQIPFGDVNEVNINIFTAHLNGENPETAISQFFAKKYPKAAEEVRAIMEETEEILIKTIYANGYLFSELSLFPCLNHSKNHFYFEMMRKNYQIASNEWYIPKNWSRSSAESLIVEKQEAIELAQKLFCRLEALKEKIDETEYEKLWVKFCNLKLVTKAWYILAATFMNYIKYFETNDEKYACAFENNLKEAEQLSSQGKELLGDKFYCFNGDRGRRDYIKDFTREIHTSFCLEKKATESIKLEQNVLDYIICGGGAEGHLLKKEVNFSDTLLCADGICRIPGNSKGAKWSGINAHGWFSYLLSIKPYAENTIKIVMASEDKQLNVSITIGNDNYVICERLNGKKEYTYTWKETEGKNTVRIRFDKISEHIPYIYTIKTLK